MNQLPNMMVLDFCEWLKRKFSVDFESYESQELDVLDLILDEEFNSCLRRYAEEYLKNNSTIKSLLHQFIDSMEFDECLEHCNLRCFDKGYRFEPKDLYWYFYECCNCKSCYKYFDKFIRNIEIGNYNNDTYYNEVSPYDLADYVRYSIGNSTPQTINFMNVLEIDLTIEIDFLEWLIRTENKPINISLMPLEIFENLVTKYQSDCCKDDKAKQKLIKAFKQSDSNRLAQKLKAVLSYDTERKAKSLGYIVERYSDRKIPYKCIILPLGTKKSSREYQRLIKDFWYDLHYMSGDLLDIYYSEVDYGKSGYEIANALSYMPQHFKGKLPGIALWQDDMKKALNIHIGSLNSSDVFAVISKIVELIQANTPFETIVKESECEGMNIREKERPIQSTVINGDNNSVNQTCK